MMNVLKTKILRTGLPMVGLAVLGLFGLALPLGHARERMTIEPSIDVLFSPGGGCTDRILDEIGRAERRVFIQAYFFTSKPITDALIAAKKRGVECILIADKSQEKMTYGRLPVLARAGVRVLIDDKHAVANSKIILIDDETIFTGSLNFTKAAEDENAENLFSRYLSNFEEHRAHSRAYKSR
jgi:phosphatidylserine/phosphatidylglycerophosphate/cardiolipin synthase-like enzyme